jgi:hypothetical protein
MNIYFYNGVNTLFPDEMFLIIFRPVRTILTSLSWAIIILYLNFFYSIEWDTYDYHSGIESVHWRLYDNFTGSEILHGQSHLHSQGRAEVNLGKYFTDMFLV